MQFLQHSYLFTLPKPQTPIPSSSTLSPLPPYYATSLLNPSPLHHLLIAKSFSFEEFPTEETLLENLGPKDKETEDEARHRNWIERSWAPLDEILTPEIDFARKSLNQGEDVPLRTPEAIEAFKMLSTNLVNEIGSDPFQNNIIVKNSKHKINTANLIQYHTVDLLDGVYPPPSPPPLPI